MNKTIFAVRPLDLARVSQIGFSLDNVLVMYTRHFHCLVYDLVKALLESDFAYPREVLESLSYTVHYATSAYVVDPQEGTAMQLDEFSNIIACVRGHTKLSKHEYTAMYPERAIRLPGRFYVQNDSFSQVFVCLFMDLVQAFFMRFQTVRDPLCDTEEAIPSTQPGTIVPQLLFEDLRKAYEKVVCGRRSRLLEELKKQSNLYFKNQIHLCEAVVQLRQSKQLFILSAAGFDYCDFCLGEIYGTNYRTIFDYIILDTSIDRFETSEQPFRRYESYKFLGGTGPLRKNEVYSGGNFALFTQYTRFKPTETLYCCDVLPDSRISNKRAQWHYCAVSPSISREAKIINQQSDILAKISALEARQRQILGKCGLQSSQKPAELTSVQSALQIACQRYMDCFGIFGSKYQTSWALTKLGDDILQKADLYTSSISNFYYYSIFYYFSSSVNTRFLPHQTAIYAAQDENHITDPSEHEISTEVSPPGNK